ncbi:TPA: hypothetical protein N0J77_002684 [Pseudomonas aeruginosa]|uniref:hypothetical protein n=1 Tax=Pseudomonas aeruginosa TaxID=287 RepID=UPI002942998D|nr:hypothetical protein [Pseudomonas aeruginosa]WOJ10996.1 hypothetical protein M0M55_21200 [Pseudomonas aeruginosa]HCK4323262.1 hypothetical protein [Pseudomonas aeruginosa]HCK5623202.1 hypothetical protein [Pseudomonas aeruginosa]
MNRILDILIPRFITERVALLEANDGHLEIACALSDVRPGERFDAIATMRGFNLLGRIIFPRMIGAPRPWPEYIEPLDPPPCPFCEGTPAVAVQSPFTPNDPVCRQTDYGCDGRDVDAYVFCESCGAQGPQYENVIFEEADFLSAEIEAARLWIERTAKHRHLYDANAKNGLTTYPRPENRP